MKHTTLACALLCLNTALHAEDYAPIIVQTTEFTEGDPTVQYLTPSDMAGSMEAHSDVLNDSFKSAKFELYSAETVNIVTPSTQNMEDQTIFTYHTEAIMGVFIPDAEITVTATDEDENGNPMTRADKFVDIHITVDGLKVGIDEAQDSMKSVEVYHKYTNHGTGVSIEGDPTTIDTNETYTYRQDYQTDITPADGETTSNNIYGEEIISVYALPDFGFDNSSELDSVTLTICPLTTGSIEGIDAGASYATLPELTYSLGNTYPGCGKLEESSFCRVVCYPGGRASSQSLETLGSGQEDLFILANIHTNSQTEPEPKTGTITSKNLHEALNDSGAGTYTIEVVQSSVYGIDRFDYVTFKYVPEIKINANNMTSSE